MIYKEETVEFDPGKGPVTVEVTSDYPTLGKFKLGYMQEGKAVEYGGGDLADAVPDVFIVPIMGESLDGLYSFIIGNYSPGDIAAHPQVALSYHFKQVGRILSTISIREQTEGLISAYHLITFQGKA